MYNMRCSILERNNATEANMKLLFVFLLLKVIKGTAHNVNDGVVQKWLNMDAALKKGSDHLMKSLLPSAILFSAGVSYSCKRGLIDLQRGIAHTKHWAFKMLDSSGKLPNGILGGTFVSLGDYDTCLDVDVVNSFQGKYCLVDIKTQLPERQIIRPDEERIPSLINLSANDSVINEVLKYGGYLYIMKLRTSICMPSTCTKDDVQNIVSKVLEISGLDVNVKSCEVKNDVIHFTSFEKVLVLILGTLFLVVIVATIMDLFQRIENYDKRKDKRNLLLYFSLFTNGAHLFKKDDNPDSIRIFHGFRVISILWIILCHTYTVTAYQAYDGLKNAKTIPKQFGFQLIANGFMAVETFFFMCAVLLSYHTTKDHNPNIVAVFVKRYIRITIPHLFVIACVCLLPLLSSGPLYKEIIDTQAQNCRNVGWMNILYINNYLPFTKMCMGVTWFLSTDTQLFLLSILVIIPLKNKPKVKFLLLGILLVCGLVGSVISQIIFRLPPTNLVLNSDIQHMSWIWERSYFLPHFHLPTYCVGLTVGYILAEKRVLVVPKKINVILWIASIVVGFSVVFGVYAWNSGHEYPGLFISVIYGSTHRFLWALSLAWITIACYFNKEGIVSRFLGAGAFVPLSRLSYMAYLTHLFIKFLYIGTIRNTITYDHKTNLFLYCGIVTFTFTLSTIMSLIFEAPFLRLQKDLTNKLRFKTVIV